MPKRFVLTVLFRVGSHSRSTALPDLLSGNPLPYVEWTIPKFNAVRFTKTKDVNDRAAHKSDLFQVNYCLLSAALDLDLQ
jgi:hypothetical protein